MKLRSGWPSDVISGLKRRVRHIANSDEVSIFYIGRTTDLIASRSRHRCHDIIPIYKTSSADHATQIEYELIDTFYDHPKCDNDAPHSGGGVADDYTNYVYVAVWYY